MKSKTRPFTTIEPTVELKQHTHLHENGGLLS